MIPSPCDGQLSDSWQTENGALTESPVAALVDVDPASKGTRVLTYSTRIEALEAAGLSE